VDGGKVDSQYSEFLHTQMSSDGPYVMFQDDLPPPFPRIFVMPCTAKLLQLLKMISSIDSSLSMVSLPCRKLTPGEGACVAK